MPDLTTLSATALLEGIKNKIYSCAEIMQAYLQRIDQVNPQLNAVVQRLDTDIAMQQAKLADEQLAKGIPIGKLHGLPQIPKNLGTRTPARSKNIL